MHSLENLLLKRLRTFRKKDYTMYRIGQLHTNGSLSFKITILLLVTFKQLALWRQRRQVSRLAGGKKKTNIPTILDFGHGGINNIQAPSALPSRKRTVG